jgi:hypothetical protein
MPEIDPAIEAARTTLLRRGRSLALRARRSRVGSNQRAEAVHDAHVMSLCVAAIDDDKKLRKHLAKEGVLDTGWRTLADTIAAYYTREKPKARHA